VRAAEPPYVVLTSNRVRELGEALRRRCLYLWIDYPGLAKEMRIVRSNLPRIDEDLARQICLFVEAMREMDLDKRPGVTETLDWAMALLELHQDHLSPEITQATLGCLAKTKRDTERVQRDLSNLLERAARSA
jgi:MoxR-like ATPase